eukprot:TRINITY_DN1177_c0_g1_i1.p1 TRINITY_DN1177_c0_g1~~TRINITY_DN1177_c0_g1_i1.p1  ORF type:complete len:149 (-),score=6.72 TRINITY_DN1177_c0_g1_i1:82-528(-)
MNILIIKSTNILKSTIILNLTIILILMTQLNVVNSESHEITENLSLITECTNSYRALQEINPQSTIDFSFSCDENGKCKCSIGTTNRMFSEQSSGNSWFGDFFSNVTSMYVVNYIVMPYGNKIACYLADIADGKVDQKAFGFIDCKNL